MGKKRGNGRDVVARSQTREWVVGEAYASHRRGLVGGDVVARSQTREWVVGRRRWKPGWDHRCLGERRGQRY